MPCYGPITGTDPHETRGAAFQRTLDELLWLADGKHGKAGDIQ
jgi:hypothetical protein